MNVDAVNKRSLRRDLIRLRIALTGEEQLSVSLNQRLIQFLHDKKFRTVGFYMPIKGEVDVLPALEQWQSLCGGQLALPVTEGGTMSYRKWKKGDALKSSEFGILEPEGAEEVVCDVLIVPCVGFNEACYRLGYGGGYFDKYLEKLPNVRTIGIGIEACCVKNLQPEAHDIPLDAIITETQIRVGQKSL